MPPTFGRGCWAKTTVSGKNPALGGRGHICIVSIRSPRGHHASSSFLAALGREDSYQPHSNISKYNPSIKVRNKAVHVTPGHLTQALITTPTK